MGWYQGLYCKKIETVVFKLEGRTMSKKRIVLSIVLICLTIMLNVLFIKYEPSVENERVVVNITVQSENENAFELFYIENAKTLKEGFTAEKSQIVNYKKVGQKEVLSYTVPAGVSYLRLDFGAGESTTVISAIEIVYGEQSKELSADFIGELESVHETKISIGEDGLEVISQMEDPYIVWNTAEWNVSRMVSEARANVDMAKKILACISIDIICFMILKYAKRVAILPIELYRNKKLVFNLAKNDFKTKFAGSYLGIIWAFVQPVITVLLYWFVFEKGLKAGGINTKEGITVPFVLWLIAGIVPWFFFQEALNGATNALIEYSYLVKKVVFQISILPIVKIVSALFVHLFFIAFTVVLYAGYGYYPDAYTIQIIYYSVAMFLFVLGVSYATCAIIGFFRDLSQIINIVLQIGMWMTPIMWNIDTMELPSTLLTVFKLNPVYYIVQGYRDALINKRWFWESPELTVYFWIVTIFMFGIGSVIFKRLKVHFADVL